MLALFAAALLGIVTGLRTFTALAVLWLMRHTGPIAYLLGVGALLEYAGDLHPSTPSRTAPFGLAARLVTGAFCGWAVTHAANAGIAGALIGAGGAVAGAYGGLAVRTRAILLLGRVPAALLEDLVAIGSAYCVVSFLVI
jgi:uncharacterized membrane protein